jgi:predicted N-acetyltransferase YhbS
LCIVDISNLADLQIVAVKDTLRGQGVGTGLVKFCLEKSRAAGVPLCLYSVPRAKDFYLRLGFKETSYAEIDLSKFARPYEGYGLHRTTAMMAD